ncbi:rsph1, partial [Symbiodinium sp. CCMP2592]
PRPSFRGDHRKQEATQRHRLRCRPGVRLRLRLACLAVARCPSRPCQQPPPPFRAGRHPPQRREHCQQGRARNAARRRPPGRFRRSGLVRLTLGFQPPRR